MDGKNNVSNSNSTSSKLNNFLYIWIAYQHEEFFNATNTHLPKTQNLKDDRMLSKRYVMILW